MDTLVVVGRLNVMDERLVEHLEAEGLEVIKTTDTDEVLRLCRYERPALAFVEVDDPGDDRFELISKLRQAMDGEGRIVAICNRYNERMDDYCERLGANLTLPQVKDQANFGLFVRGLITLMPERTGARAVC